MTDSQTTSRGPLRELLALAVPLAGTMLAGIAMPISDGIMCGHISDHDMSLEALGLGLQLWFLLCTPLWALDTGVSALASRAHGAGDRERLNRIAAQSAQLALVLGLAFGAVSALFGRQIMALFGASPEVTERGAAYLRMLAVAFPVYYVAEGCLASLLRSVGNTRLPFVCGVAANALNVLLAYALVFGHFGLPELGIVGAGLATAIANVANLVFVLVGMRGGAVAGLVVRPLVVAYDRAITSDIVKVAAPALLTTFTFFGAMTAFYWLLGHIDEPAVTAHAVGARVAAFLLVPTFAYSAATGSLVGKALGAAAPDQARRVLRVALAAVVATMVPIAAAAWFGARWILAAYDVAPGSVVETYALRWLHVVAVALVLQGILNIFEGLLNGAGASKAVMKISVSVDVGLRLTVATVLGMCTSAGAFGVWLSWPVALAVEIPLAYVVYRRGRWATTGVAVEG